MGRTNTSDAEPDVNIPGLGGLREAVANQRPPDLPRRATLRQDGLAAVSTAISSVPDGMVSAVLAGVNPIYGLYAVMVGPIVGGLLSSTHLMVVTTTSAAALAAGQTLASLPTEKRDSALFLMVLLMGAFQILCGLLRLGRLIRFVSYSVMTGFLIGIAVLIVLSQLPTVTGYAPAGSSTVAKTFSLLANLGAINPPSLGLSVLTLALAITLPHTRLGNLGILVAIAVPSALVAFFPMVGVEIVRDVGAISRSIPTLYWPSFSDFNVNVLTGALAVTVIILVQGAGVSQSVPNPDGSRGRASRDFIAQGAANVASGLFRGLPVGGSLSATALSVEAGARSRWAAIFAGMWVGVFVMVAPGLISHVAMPTLGALLLIAGVSTIKPSDALLVWRTGWPSRLSAVATFLSTVFLPIQAAVGIGVVLSALIYLYESSTEIAVVELVRRSDGRIEERKPPKHLPANSVTVLDVHGHLFYAGARMLEQLLPTSQGAQNAVVILRLRGRADIGATLIHVLSGYAKALQAANGRLYLTGLSKEMHDQLVRTGKLNLTGPVRAYAATPILGQSTHEAYADAQTWLVGASTEGSADEAAPDDASARTS